MAKQAEKKAGKAIDLNRAVQSAKSFLTVGMTELRIQRMLERMQIANATADYSVDSRLRKAEKLRAQAEENEAKLKGLRVEGKNVVSVANYKPLADYFNGTLSHFTEESFTNEATIEMSKFLARVAKGVSQKLTKEQEEVVVTYYTNRARANWDRVSEIRIILDVKGLLKGKKAAVSLPTEQELAGQE